MIKIGIFGAHCGGDMIELCERLQTAEVVAVCENDELAVKKLKRRYPDRKITYYANFDDFIKHKADAVVLANCAHKHAPYAVKCLDAGKHVLSEVLPCQNLKEAVELIEAVERSGKIYAYGENYCYLPAPREMKKLFKAGKLGEFEYGEGEYLHNCEPVWADITYGLRDHWRNAVMYATFYCTHSFGPIRHITGLRPVTVTGYELPFTDRCARMGRRSGIAGIEMVTLENGGIVRSIHGALDKTSVMYRIYGSRGRIESGQADAGTGGVKRVYLNLDRDEGVYYDDPRTYTVDDETNGEISDPHGGSDVVMLKNFIAAVSGKPCDIVDVYEALDMFLPGLFAWFSVLDGGKPQKIPDLRDKSEREKFRNDTRCTDAEAAGNMLLPVYSKGMIDIPDVIYDGIRERYIGNNKENE